MLSLAKHIIVFALFFILSGYNSSGQVLQCRDVCNKLLSIDTSTLPGKAKLVALYHLKTQVEKSALTNDSSFVLLLIKLAKWEYEVNGNINIAIDYTKAAIDRYKNNNPNAVPFILRNALYNLAYYYQSSLQYEQALDYYKLVIEKSKTDNTESYITSSRYNRTLIYFFLGDYQKASDESTIGIQDVNLFKDSSYFTALLNLRSYSYYYQNQLQKAKSDIETSLPIAQKDAEIKLPADQKEIQLFDLADCFEIKGLLYQKEKNYNQAEFFLSLAIKTRPQIPKYFRTVTYDYLSLAILYYQDLGLFKQAKRNLDKAIAVSRQCALEDRTQRLFMCYTNLGKSYLKEGDLKTAMNHFATASQYLQINPSQFITTKESTSRFADIGYKEIIFSYLFGKTELLLQLFKHTKDTFYLSACIETAKVTDTLITQTRHENIGENSKLFWRNETRFFYSHALEACYQAHDINAAYYFMENSRAALLKDNWNENDAKAYLPDSIKNHEEELKLKIVELQLQLSPTAPYVKKYLEIENQLLVARLKLETYTADLEKNYASYRLHKYDDKTVSLASLQEFLCKNNQGFVYYFLDDTTVYALGLYKNQTCFIKTAANEFDTKDLTNISLLCNNVQTLNKNYKALYIGLSNRIYNKMLKPFQIPEGKLSICTDNFFIPFEGLCTDNTGKRFLLQDYAINYVYSAQALLKSFAFHKPSGNFIGFAPVSFASSLDVFPLLNSSQALQNAADYYTNNTLITNQQATRNSFFNQAPHYSIVTIFSHAWADTTDTEPMLYMQDAVIHLSELQLLKESSIQFVLLSACQTNIGKKATGEGIYSLARGFAASGIPAVSATLWKADEETIYRISKKFNQYLATGMNKSEALQKAKLWYLQNSDREHALPFYWANLVLIGSSEPISLSNPDNNSLWVILLTGIIIFLSGLFIYKYKRHNKSTTNINR